MSEFPEGNSQINLEGQELRKGPSVELMQKDLWTELHRIGNEMIITNRGNLITPRLTVRISNLDPTKLYKVVIDCEPKDDFDYKFNGLNWRIRSESGRKNHGSFYTHPSPVYACILSLYHLRSLILYCRLLVSQVPLSMSHY